MIYPIYKKWDMMKNCSAFISSLYLLNSNMNSTKSLTFSSVSSRSNPPTSFSLTWTCLPQDLLFMVLNKLLLLSDMIRFAGVCSNWRSVAKDRFKELNLRANMHYHNKLPMLLLPNTENSASMSNLFCITHGEIYDLNLPFPYTKRYCGSSHGWLIILDDVSFVITLINPFYFGNSQGIIHLPPFIAALDTSEETGQNFNCESFVSKAILSSDPITSPDDYALMLIYGDLSLLSFWKSGDTHWTYIWSGPVFYDVIYSQGQFLAVNIIGQVYSCDVGTKPPELSKISRPLLGVLGAFCRRYIVELPDGTIVQIIRYLKSCACNRDAPSFFTVGFILYKMFDDNGTFDWLSIRSLGEGALFLGDNHSLYVNASQFPGCRQNSIYFTDSSQDTKTYLLDSSQSTGRLDIGICHLDEDIIKRINYPLSERSRLPPPIWINPTI